MKFIIDMNLAPSWVAIFENAGHEAQHWSSVGNPRAADAEILSWARANNAVVFTNDLDFGAILTVSHAQLPSVLQVREEDLFPEAIRTIVMNAIVQFERELCSGALVVVEPWRHRCRILPLPRD